ncbi:MAG: hypothetical protein OEZ57_07515 [Nitrospirota bacterium]|nr:hypothetical protein [Nitrospirota bacterium]MDH5587128.1 hypothetical protein [Nitrospirota bacterium]MDH5774748.1 hypothetical protein [Nitrospirota bacterium]
MHFYRLSYAAFFIFLVGCAPTLTWIADPSPIPSCQPARLLQWSDFTSRVPQDQRGAETAIRFLHHPLHHRLSIAFDFEHSWVKADLIDPQNVALWRMSEHLLAHEQLHFLISCLVVRQANFSLTEEDNLWKMLELTKSVAQRLNLQYDSDTKHGLDLDAQASWEAEVMTQFRELKLRPASFPSSQVGGT